MIGLVIADNHVMVRQGIRCLLEHAHDMEVLAEAGDGQEAIDLCNRFTPDILIIDVAMPRMNGIQAVEQICTKHNHHQHTRAIMLTTHDDITLVQRSLRAGASAYVLKTQDFSELLEAIRTVNCSGTYFSPSISQALLDLVIRGSYSPAGDEPFERLTLRERELLKLIAEGYSNQEMADILQISIKTIQKHRSNLIGKLNVHGIAGLTHVAIKHGLVLMEN